MNVLSNPAMACGSQYSSDASRSTSPSVNWFVPWLSLQCQTRRADVPELKRSLRFLMTAELPLSL